MKKPPPKTVKNSQLTQGQREWILANAEALGLRETARQMGCSLETVRQLLASREVVVSEIRAEREKTVIRHWLDDKDRAARMHGQLAEALLYNLAAKAPDGVPDYESITASGNNAPIVREVRAELREIADLRGWIIRQSNVRVSDLSTEQIIALLEADSGAGGEEAGSAAGAVPD